MDALIINLKCFYLKLYCDCQHLIDAFVSSRFFETFFYFAYELYEPICVYLFQISSHRLQLPIQSECMEGMSEK